MNVTDLVRAVSWSGTRLLPQGNDVAVCKNYVLFGSVRFSPAC